VLGLDEENALSGSADGSLDHAAASHGSSRQNGRPGGQAQNGRVREPSGVSKAKGSSSVRLGATGTRAGGTAGEESTSDESSGHEGGMLAAQPPTLTKGGPTCGSAHCSGHGCSAPGKGHRCRASHAEEQWRVLLGLPARRPRPSLVSRAMASVGTRSGLRRFKTLARRLGRLRRRHWFSLPTSVERAFLVGSMRAFAQAAGAMDEEAADAVVEHQRQGRAHLCAR
jgi:hypothetical protein